MAWYLGDYDEHYDDCGIEDEEGNLVCTVSMSTAIRICNITMTNDKLQAENEKLRKVVEAAKKASQICDDFYLKSKHQSETISINEDDCEVWYARDILQQALKELEGE